MSDYKVDTTLRNKKLILLSDGDDSSGQLIFLKRRVMFVEFKIDPFFIFDPDPIE